MKSRFISLVILVLSLQAFANESLPTYHLFYGKVTGVTDGTEIVGKVGEQNFTTIVKNGQYGYDPEFKIVGSEDSIIEFYINGLNVANATLRREGMSGLDLSTTVQPLKQEVTVLPPAPLPQEIKISPSVAVYPARERTSSFWSILLIALSFFALIALFLFLYARRSEQIVDPKAVEYVRNMLNIGYTREQTAAYLAQYGWSRDTVERIFRELDKL